ncbi:MAG: hypothetical protein GX414_15090 [Acidobacteria bacterium]|nr:hypothetical protein [Acidobacteriota bacterium]
MITEEPAPYDFPDRELLNADGAVYRCLVWQPAAVCVVIGRGNSSAASVFLDRAAADGVAVVQRPSGGEAVVLSPRTLAVSAVHRAADQMASRRYFELFNGAAIRALAGLGVTGLSRRGISDIALGDRKILGSSIYRNRRQVLYHAVLNVAESPELMERYLRPPGRQPDYRRDRSHRDFVTSLAAAGYALSMAALHDALHTALTRVVLSPAPPSS